MPFMFWKKIHNKLVHKNKQTNKNQSKALPKNVLLSLGRSVKFSDVENPGEAVMLCCRQ